MTDHQFLPPLSLEENATIWWRSGNHAHPYSWECIAGWCFGAASVACRADDRRDWDLLRAIAWDHAGARRPALDEVAA